MSEYNLPSQGSPQDYKSVLQELIQRYEQTGEPVHYEKTAIDVHRTVSSSILSYLSKIGLIQSEGSGKYTPEDVTIDCINGNTDEEGLIGFFDQDEVCQESKYLKGRGVSDLNELAEKTAEQLDIDDDELEKVRRAIRIFSEFGVLDSSENNGKEVVQVDEPQSKETKQQNDSILFSKESGIDWSVLGPDDFETPPTRAKPNHLHEVCEVFDEKGGGLSEATLSENTEINDDYVSDVVKYGIQLGFLEQNEDGYSATPEGYSLVLDNNTEESFQQGLKNQKLYLTLIYGAVSEESFQENRWVDRDTLKSILRTRLGFTKSKDNLERKISTLLQTLEAAGYGEYVQGSGSYPTRVEISDEDELINEVEEALIERHGVMLKKEGREQKTRDGVEAKRVTPGEGVSEGVDPTTEPSDETATSHDDMGPEKTEKNEDSAHGITESGGERDVTTVSTKSVEELNIGKRTATVDINIQLELSEIDAEDLQKKLSHIDSFLNSEEETE